MQKEMLPEKGVMCHRTGFEKACRHCVVEHGCQLWVRLAGTDKDTGGPIDLYGCADKFAPQIATQSTAQLTQMLQLVAGETNALRLEVQGQTIKPMLDNIVDINRQLAAARLDPTKLLANGSGN